MKHAEQCDSKTRFMPGTEGKAYPCDCAASFTPGPIEKRTCLCGATFFEAEPYPEQYPTAEGVWLCKRCAATLQVVGVVNSRGQLMPRAGYGMPGAMRVGRVG